MAKRLPSAPPALAGFSFLRVLGSGGFADVFLFEQDMPRRTVAVKVMVPEAVTEDVRRMFVTEANLMATLSSHPSILTVYAAGVSQDGRPYLVMEYCVTSLGQRYRREQLPVADVLRVAVKIGSAVHAAHQLGILHRDVKPGNILLTSYGNPVLSDFGIAGRTHRQGPSDAVGLSVPWSAPEVLAEETTGTHESEIYSFGATVYSLLAGRSPFERLAGETREPYTQTELIRRIRATALPPTSRADVPAALENSLARSMAKDPADRQESVLALVREYQGIETSLGLAQTPLESELEPWGASLAAGPGDPSPERTVRAPTAEREPMPRQRGRRNLAAGTKSRRSRAIFFGVLGLAVVGAGAGLVFATGSLSVTSGPGIPRVGEISTVSGAGIVRFDWQDPGLAEGDSYVVTTGDGTVSVQRGVGFTASAGPGRQICVTVAVTRAGRAGPASAEKCADAS